MKLNCIGCNRIMRKPESKVCTKCCLKTHEFGIKTASDYDLSDDHVIRGLAFLDACGVLKDFFDKCYSGSDAFVDETKRTPRINVNDVDPTIIDMYEEHDSNWFEITTLKSPIRWQGSRKQ